MMSDIYMRLPDDFEYDDDGRTEIEVDFDGLRARQNRNEKGNFEFRRDDDEDHDKFIMTHDGNLPNLGATQASGGNYQYRMRFHDNFIDNAMYAKLVI